MKQTSPIDVLKRRGWRYVPHEFTNVAETIKRAKRRLEEQRKAEAESKQ